VTSTQRFLIAVLAIAAACTLAALDRGNVAVAVGIVTAIVGHVLGEQTGQANALARVPKVVDEHVRALAVLNREAARSQRRRSTDPPLFDAVPRDPLKPTE
jgi:hypothetical protein